MTKGEALQTFFGRFDLAAYTTASVPKDVIFPYLTYEMVTNDWYGGEVSMTVNLWFYTKSEAVPNAKAQEISDYIGPGGVMVPCDGGAIWIKRGSPWCQSLYDAANPGIKRRYLNVTAEFITMS